MRVGKLPSLRSSERVQVFQPGVKSLLPACAVLSCVPI